MIIYFGVFVAINYLERYNSPHELLRNLEAPYYALYSNISNVLSKNPNLHLKSRFAHLLPNQKNKKVFTNVSFLSV
jgi:hypothetical protein